MRQSSRRRKPKSRLLRLLRRTFSAFFKIFNGSVLWGILFLFVAGAGGAAFFSPYFEIKKIVISRDNPNLDPAQVEESLKNLTKTKLFLIPRQDIRRKLFSDFPEFLGVELVQHWPAKLEIKIKTSPAMFNLLNRETANFVVISENGVVLQQGAQEGLATVKVFGYEKILMPHQVFIEKEVLDKIHSARNLVTQKLLLPLKDTHYYHHARELHIISRKNMQIWVDLNRPILMQLEKIEQAANRIGIYKTPMHHIDVRIPQEIFWEEG